MSSLKRHEGYLLIDNRGLPAVPRHPSGQFDSPGTNQLYECATITCAHCNAVVILRPDRSRPREYCRKCDKYICDECSGKPCYPIEKVLDDLEKQANHEIVIARG